MKTIPKSAQYIMNINIGATYYLLFVFVLAMFLSPLTHVLPYGGGDMIASFSALCGFVVLGITIWKRKQFYITHEETTTHYRGL